MESNDNAKEKEEAKSSDSTQDEEKSNPVTMSPPSGAVLLTNMQLPTSTAQSSTSPKQTEISSSSELPSQGSIETSTSTSSSEAAPISSPPSSVFQSQGGPLQVSYASSQVLQTTPISASTAQVLQQPVSSAAQVTLLPSPRPPGLAPGGPLAPGSLATLVLPTSTPRPLLVLPSPSPTLLVSSPRLMRLPLLLPTQTLQLLPPASMDTQGKKSVLLTTIKVGNSSIFCRFLDKQ